MTYLENLYSQLAEAQALPPNVSAATIVRLQQLIAIEQARVNRPGQDLNDINTTLGSRTSPPAILPTSNASMVSLQKLGLEKASELNEMDFASSFLQGTGNALLASIYGVSTQAKNLAASIYGYIQRPSNLMLVSSLSSSTVSGLIADTNDYLASSIYGFYSSQMVFDSVPPDVYMIITEQPPPAPV